MAACALVFAGCLDDLPDPLSCPPAPVVAGSNNTACVQQLVNDTSANAALFLDCRFEPEYIGCYRPNDDCACEADECPTPEEPCYPGDDCPALVRESDDGEGARCLRLDPEDLESELEGSDGPCLCGCRRCAIACDGRGVVWSQSVAYDMMGTRYGPDSGVMLWGIDRDMPDAGRLGVYMRARGTSGFLVAGALSIYAADTWTAVLQAIAVGMMGPEPDATYTLLRDWEDGFSEELYPEAASEAYVWNVAGRKPAVLVLYPGISGTVLEIDCVFPVVF